MIGNKVNIFRVIYINKYTINKIEGTYYVIY